MLGRFLPAFHLMQGLARDQARRRKLAILQRSDPLFERCMHILGWCLTQFNPDIQRMLHWELRSSPRGFMRLYAKLRQLADDVERTRHAMRSAG